MKEYSLRDEFTDVKAPIMGCIYDTLVFTGIVLLLAQKIFFRHEMLDYNHWSYLLGSLLIFTGVSLKYMWLILILLMGWPFIMTMAPTAWILAPTIWTCFCQVCSWIKKMVIEILYYTLVLVAFIYVQLICVVLRICVFGLDVWLYNMFIPFLRLWFYTAIFFWLLWEKIACITWRWFILPPYDCLRHINELDCIKRKSPTCVYCLEKYPECVFEPCNHMVYCDACALKNLDLTQTRNEALRCPVCRANVVHMKYSVVPQTIQPGGTLYGYVHPILPGRFQELGSTRRDFWPH